MTAAGPCLRARLTTRKTAGPCLLAVCTGLLFFFHLNLAAQDYPDKNRPVVTDNNQRYSLDQFTIERGLSDNTVNACLQDRTGYLWFGTNDGLNRYDGYSFHVYKHQPGNPHSISNNKVNALLEDKQGYIWIATDGGLNRFDPRTENFMSHQHNPNDENSISHNQANCLLEDEAGHLWVGTNHGLNRFEQRSQAFSHYWHQATHHQPWEKEPAHIVLAIGQAANGQLLVGYAGLGLMLLNPGSGTFRQVFAENIKDKGIGLRILGISAAQNGENWVAGGEKLFRYRADGTLVLATVTQPDNGINGILPTANGQYLAPGWYGLYILDADFQAVGSFLPGGLHPPNPTYNWVNGVLEDRRGDIWFGTGGAGLFHINTQAKPFTSYKYPAEKDNAFPHSYINALLEVQADELWVGTRRHGLKIFNPKTKQFRPAPSFFNPPHGLNTNELSVLYQDSQGNIWFGTWGGGLNLYRPGTGTFQYFLTNNDGPTSLTDNYVTDIMETDRHEIWVSTTLGISVLANTEAIEKGFFKNYRHSPEKAGTLNHSRATCLLQASNGQIWAGTLNGLHLYNPASDAFFLYQQDMQDPNSLANNTINTIFEDSRGNLWVGTAGGLGRFDAQNNAFEHFTEKDGLANGYIIAIQEDGKGQLWLATKSGISSFSLENRQFRNYNNRDGLSANGFNTNAFIRSKNKAALYAGGINGLALFYPDSIGDDTFVPPVVISGLSVYKTLKGKTVESDIKGIAYRDKVELYHRDNTIVFRLAALNFQNPEKTKYAYRLEGFNKGWIELGAKREITFTNLDPGQYTLRVSVSNNEGAWNVSGATLKIIVHPPWWASGWAYAFYAFTLVSLLLFLRRYELNRQSLKARLEREQFEAEKLKELDSFKSRLYTNLTHEFRTPLTVILGMAKQMTTGRWRSEVDQKEQERVALGLDLIEHNGQNLLRLINQLLDLSKLENKSFRLYLQQSDIVPYLRYLAESFQTFASTRGLNLRFSSALESLVMDYDPEQLKQVMSNLISNAIKFTPSGGEVSVQLASEQGAAGPTLQVLVITVTDTGAGIATEHLPHIFGRFFQARSTAFRKGTTEEDSGTGIGLAHTQELVKLMDGKILVESELGKGTSFTVQLPVRREADAVDAMDTMDAVVWPVSKTSAEALTNGEAAAASNKPLLLIIEDNQDIIVYLQSCLEGLYQMEVAYNGKAGIDKALDAIPDLIISDVMMPEKDGYEVCDTLKNDERTSHIPIILLTAKADMASRITGLRRGADAYLAKPFDKEELLVRLEKLLELRQRLQERYATIADSAAAAPPVSSADYQLEDAFIQKIQGIVDAHYGDESFGLPQLCQLIGMSRSQLFRKMKALINESPSDFIRSYRLSKARALLEITNLNVSEVAWQVGYKDPAHFSKSFQDAFGLPPSAIRKV